MYIMEHNCETYKFEWYGDYFSFLIFQKNFFLTGEEMSYLKYRWDLNEDFIHDKFFLKYCN